MTYLVKFLDSDGTGLNLPSGYIKREVIEWLEENIGGPCLNERYRYRASYATWGYEKEPGRENRGFTPDNNRAHVFAFLRRIDAIRFRLAWKIG